jgi:rod shape-determining protein MreD
MRLKILIYAIFLFLLLLLQSTLLGYVNIYNVKPNLLIIFVVCVALLRGNTEGAVVGFFAGLILDMSFGKLLGLYALLGMFLGLIVGSVNKRLYRENFLVVIFFTFVSTVIYESIVYILNTFMSGNIDMIWTLTMKILPEAIYNSLVSILIFAIVRKMSHRFDKTSKNIRKY